MVVVVIKVVVVTRIRNFHSTKGRLFLWGGTPAQSRMNCILTRI